MTTKVETKVKSKAKAKSKLKQKSKSKVRDDYSTNDILSAAADDIESSVNDEDEEGLSVHEMQVYKQAAEKTAPKAADPAKPQVAVAQIEQKTKAKVEQKSANASSGMNYDSYYYNRFGRSNPYGYEGWYDSAHYNPNQYYNWWDWTGTGVLPNGQKAHLKDDTPKEVKSHPDYKKLVGRFLGDHYNDKALE